VDLPGVGSPTTTLRLLKILHLLDVIQINIKIAELHKRLISHIFLFDKSIEVEMFDTMELFLKIIVESCGAMGFDTILASSFI
jgi:hypothetical protein